MALIKCVGCGHTVSDKATKCPKCGTPIHRGEEAAKSEEKEKKVVAEVDSQIIESEALIEEYAEEPQSNKWIIGIVCGVLLLAATVGTFLFWHNNQSDETDNPIVVNDSDTEIQGTNSQQVIEEVFVEDVEEETVEEYVDSVTSENVSESICYSYIQALYDYAEDEYVSCNYFLYDITKDGIPELWIKVGTCEADYTLMVYTYENGLYKTICEKPAGHSVFYRGGDYILQQYAHQGVATWIKLTYDGNMVIEKTIYDENTIGTDNDYKIPTEEIIELYTFNNEQPIKKAFGME